MSYRRFTSEMSPVERRAWWKRQAGVEGEQYERMGKARTAASFSADKRRVSHRADEWYAQATCYYKFR